MTHACARCWGPVNWTEAFSKFGHGDGDDCVHTTQVASAIRRAGYQVDVLDGGLHNPRIERIADAATGVEVWPGRAVAGHDDPTGWLPPALKAALERRFGPATWFA